MGVGVGRLRGESESDARDRRVERKRVVYNWDALVRNEWMYHDMEAKNVLQR